MHANGIPVRHLAVSLVALSVLVAGCSDPSGDITLKRRSAASTTVPERDPGDDPAGTTIDWGSCDDVDIAITTTVRRSADRAGMECGELEVPVDHDDPEGDTISLAVARFPAEGGDDERIGSLIVNPGGPGGSGLEFLATSTTAFPDDLRERFDIVSFDPRGIAASSPLDCLTEAQRAEIVDAESPEDPAAVAAESVETEKTIAAGCEEADPDLLQHMGTDQVAADVDALRAAVGDEGLTFLGLSYGTRIAAAYATAYPDNVRAIVLDGSVTPSRDLVDQQAGQVKGIVRAFEALVARCNADAGCPLAPDALTRFDAVGAQLDAAPLDVDGEPLTKEKYVTGVVTALYDPSASDAVLEAVAAVGGTDADRAQVGGAFLLKLAGLQSSKQPDGSYGNGFETQGVVNCLDADSPLEGPEIAEARAGAGPIPALLDQDPAADSPSCTALPTGDDLEIGTTSAVDRLLVVGTQGDPATPIEWTREMATALGDPAVLVYEGSGHTATLTRSCVTDQVSAFLIDAAVPADLSDCPADPDESDIYAQVAAQFESVGIGPEAKECIVNSLRDIVDPLTIVSIDDEDPDMELIGRIQDAVFACR